MHDTHTCNNNAVVAVHEKAVLLVVDTTAATYLSLALNPDVFDLASVTAVLLYVVVFFWSLIRLLLSCDRPTTAAVCTAKHIPFCSVDETTRRLLPPYTTQQRTQLDDSTVYPTPRVPSDSGTLTNIPGSL